MHGIRAPIEFLWIGPLEQQFDFILRFDELALRVIVQAGPNSVLRANVAQVIVKLARSANVLPLQYLVDARWRERHQLGSSESLEKLAGLPRRLFDFSIFRRIVGGTVEGQRGDVQVPLRQFLLQLRQVHPDATQRRRPAGQPEPVESRVADHVEHLRIGQSAGIRPLRGSPEEAAHAPPDVRAARSVELFGAPAQSSEERGHQKLSSSQISSSPDDPFLHVRIWAAPRRAEDRNCRALSPNRSTSFTRSGLLPALSIRH